MLTASFYAVTLVPTSGSYDRVVVPRVTLRDSVAVNILRIQ